MKTFAGRRWLAGLISLVVAAAMSVVLVSHSLSLHGTAYMTGWVLLAVMLFLAGYNVRKKLTYPPLLKSSTWLQMHIWIGYLSVVVFLFHTGFRVPNGPFEVIFAALYTALILSGVFGLFITRTFPPRMAVRGEEVVFERIAFFRRQVADQAETLILDSVKETNVTTLANFYTRELADFFSRPRHFWRHLFQSNRPLTRYRSALRAQERYLNDDEQQLAAQLADLIHLKDALDFHRALQGTLKGWLFVHIPLTYVFLMFAVVHVAIVHAFLGGLR